MELTEREVIELTIKWGFDGEEFETSKWKDRGCLQLDRTQKKLIKKLETRFHKVEVTGKGKKRKYILSNPKASPTEISDGRRNNKGISADENLIMDEFIFNRLVSVASDKAVTMTTRKWINLIGLFVIDNNDLMAFGNELKEVYGNEIKIKAMMKLTLQKVDNRIFNVFDGAIKRLEKQGKIKCKIEYRAKLIDEIVQLEQDGFGGNVKSITTLSDKQIEKIQQAEEIKLKEFGFSFDEYMMARTRKQFAKKEVVEILPKMDNFLEDEFFIKRYYKAIKIKILDLSVTGAVSHDEAYRAFIDRFVHLAKKQQAKDKHKNAITYNMRFYYFNILLFLRIKGAKWLTDEINMLRFTLKAEIEKIRVDYASDLIKQKQEFEIKKANMVKQQKDISINQDEVAQLFAEESYRKHQEEARAKGRELIDITKIGLEDDKPIKPKRKYRHRVFGDTFVINSQKHFRERQVSEKDDYEPVKIVSM